jgi:hypothetical protein
MAETDHERPGRNEPCHCGSGKKYKHCCLAKDEEAERAALAEHANAAPPADPAEAEAPARTTPRPRPTSQPWRRTDQNARFARRITTPRKVG